MILSGTCRVRVLAQASGHRGFEVDAFVTDMAIAHAISPIDVGVQRIDALITDVVQDCFIRSDSHEATDNPTWTTLTPSTDLSDLLMGRGTEYEWEKLLKQHQANIGWERRHNGGHYTRTEPFGS